MNWPLLLLVAIILIVGSYLEHWRKSKASSLTSNSAIPYTLRPCIFNLSEKKFFKELREQIPMDFCIFPKIRIIDFIDPHAERGVWINKIISKHVDYLICDSAFKPVMALELDGLSHSTNVRMIRDEFVSAVYASAGLKFYSVKVCNSYKNDISHIITLLTSERIS
jgi:hypothetical protein